jgi:hypothetical protein
MDTKHTSNQKIRNHVRRQAAPLFVLLAGLGFNITPVLADGSGVADVTATPVPCMQETAGFGLTCTANDVKIASAQNIFILDDGCAFPGDDVTFTANFEVVLTAKERHDVGIWFSSDGDPNMDGALSGSCWASTPPYAPGTAWLDLDGTADSFSGTNISAATQDTCGDIDDTHSPMYPAITMTVSCVDLDNDGKLNLPNCTSWRQPGSNDWCGDPTGAFPGSPSKCNCDLAFNIDIDVPPAELQVTKTAGDATVAEPGKGNVLFSVTVKNTSIDPANSVTLDTLVDDVYGDLLDPFNPNVSNNDCDDKVAADSSLGANETLACSFEAAVLGNAGDVHTDTVAASGLDQRSPPNRISGEDDATVTITDVLPAISVIKTVSPDNVLEPGALVTFTVTINNTSLASSDPVTIDTLNDLRPSPGGTVSSLQGMGDCSIPQTISAGGSYSCSFDLLVSGNAGDAESDLVTASGSDDDGNAVSASDDATVTINDVPSAIELLKTVDPAVLDEPGGSVSFSLTVNNISGVDSVTIDSLTDTVFGDLDGVGDCSVPQTIAAGNSYSCSFAADLVGEPGAPHMNVATASGLDDDGNPVSDNDGATVNFGNVAPAASLSKSATLATVTYAVTVSNDSDAEALVLSVLADDKFGDISNVGNPLIQSTDCILPQQLEPNDGEAGGPDEYSCVFTALVNCSPHSNTLTGSVTDNDGSAPVTPSGSTTVTLLGAAECPPDAE